MDRYSTALTSKETKLVKAYSDGQMVALIMVNSITTIFMEKALTFGLMVVSTLVNGSKTRCTEKGPILGLMVGNTKASIEMISKRAKVVLSGKMGVFTKVAGRLAFKMEKDF